MLDIFAGYSINIYTSIVFINKSNEQLAIENLNNQSPQHQKYEIFRDKYDKVEYLYN